MMLAPALLIAALSLSASAASETDLTKAIQEKFPNAKIISKADCDLGRKKVKTTAAVIQKRSAETNPLEAVIVEDVKGKLNVVVLEKKISNSNGMDSNFLNEFWDASARSASTTAIRCVVPGKDKEISPKANGEFKPAFKSKLKSFFGLYGKHVCFAASSVYNSWSCFNYAKAGAIESSFVQLNAD